MSKPSNLLAWADQLSPLTEAERALVEQYHALAFRSLKIFSKLAAKYDSYEDAVQQAQMGIIKAAKLFRPELGWKFTTFACCCIRTELDRGSRHFDRRLTAYVDEHDEEDWERVRRHRAKKYLRPRHPGREVPPGHDVEVADEVGVALARLMPMEREALELYCRFGTLREAGAEMGISKERVRQLMLQGRDRINLYMTPGYTPQYVRPPKSKAPKSDRQMRRLNGRKSVRRCA